MLNTIDISVGEVHEVTVTAYDTAGNSTNNTVRFPPVITFDAPTILSNTDIADTTITIFNPSGNPLTNIVISGSQAGLLTTPFSCVGSGSDTSDPYNSPVTCTG